VKAFDELATELQAAWHREIPLAAAMEVSVASCASDEIAVRAPLLPNRNLHGTAFAGSLFSVCVLTGWGMTWLALQRRDLAGVIVVADSRIRYRRAVSGEILCRCRVEAGVLDESLAPLAASGRASLPLLCTIDADDKVAVSFEGKYVVHARSGH
jgi:thioesterase domain-containing protein